MPQFTADEASVAAKKGGKLVEVLSSLHEFVIVLLGLGACKLGNFDLAVKEAIMQMLPLPPAPSFSTLYLNPPLIIITNDGMKKDNLRFPLNPYSEVSSNPNAK